MIHARKDYNRIQDPALLNPELLSKGSTPIAEDEPVFLLRAQDILSFHVVRYWLSLFSIHCDKEIENLEVIEKVEEHIQKMIAWQNKRFPTIPEEAFKEK